MIILKFEIQPAYASCLTGGGVRPNEEALQESLYFKIYPWLTFVQMRVLSHPACFRSYRPMGLVLFRNHHHHFFHKWWGFE